MRLFIAIELQKEILEYIYQKQQILQSYRIRGNFTRKENLHLTLRFLGEMDPKQAVQIRKALEETGATTDPFSMELGEWGQFSSRNGKILWVGIQKGKEALKTLVSNLETHLERQGFEREKRTFQPHITLGREIQLKDFPERIMKQMKMEPREVHVCRISLMESKRINGILKYAPVDRVELGRKA